MMSMRRLFQSFRDALRGIRYVFKHEQNFRIQVAAAAVVVAAILYFPLRAYETILLLVLIVMVLTMELLNTAIEQFADMFKPRLHPFVGVVKDIMAGAALITAVGALIIGVKILWPYFISFFK